MSRKSEIIDGYALYRTPFQINDKEERFVGDSKLIITKEEFLMCYNEWIKNKDEEENSHLIKPLSINKVEREIRINNLIQEVNNNIKYAKNNNEYEAQFLTYDEDFLYPEVAKIFIKEGYKIITKDYRDFMGDLHSNLFIIW